MKKIIIIFVVIIYSAITADCEIIKSPDSNTIWKETGQKLSLRSITQSYDSWNDNEIKFESLPENGFKISQKNPDKHTGGCYVPFSNDFPYLTFEIAKINFDKAGYKGFCIMLRKNKLILTRVGQSVNPQTGIYIIKAKAPSENLPKAFIAFYLYNLGVELKNLKMIKNPDWKLSVIPVNKASNTYKFSVKLKNEVEDVSIRIFTPAGMRNVKINQTDKIQLEPNPKNNLIWSQDVTIKSFSDKARLLKNGYVIVKANILGGGSGKPVWWTMNNIFENMKKDK